MSDEREGGDIHQCLTRVEIRIGEIAAGVADLRTSSAKTEDELLGKMADLRGAIGEVSSELRASIETLRRDMPGLLRDALRRAFTEHEAAQKAKTLRTAVAKMKGAG
jgi:hypothetical protein